MFYLIILVGKKRKKECLIFDLSNILSDLKKNNNDFKCQEVHTNSSIIFEPL
jgi:hypothetical protein